MDDLPVSKAADLLGVSIKTIRSLTDQGVLPVTLTTGGHRRYERDSLLHRWIELHPEWSAPVRFDREYSREGLAEDTVWHDLQRVLELGDSRNTPSPRWQTTDPTQHTGGGICFTSKAVMVFALEANSLRWIVDNERDDTAVGIGSAAGTSVELVFDRDSSRPLVDVFDRFTIDGAFARTRPVVTLFERGTEFVSRSEAKRLAAGLERFDEVELDFEGVEVVGQGFDDELFRVWSTVNPSTRLIPLRMNRAVEFMMQRGLRRQTER